MEWRENVEKETLMTKTMGKKRGRPPKKQVKEEKSADSESSLTKSCHDLYNPRNASSTDTASANVIRHKTRSLKQAPLNTTPSRNDSDNTTLSLVVKHVLFGSEPMESSDSKSPVEAQPKQQTNSVINDLPCQHEHISAQNGTINSSETENHPVPCNNSRERDANPVANVLGNGSSQNDSLMSDHIEVHGYKVKRQSVPLLTAIFKKYGDIGKESMLSVQTRSLFLEVICSIYKRLEASTFLQLTPLELKSMLDQMKDLQLVKMEIGWLNQRLNQISKAREMMYAGVSTIEDVEARTVVVTAEKTKAIQTYEKEMVKLQEKLQQEKDELDTVDEIKKLYAESLVHGLV